MSLTLKYVIVIVISYLLGSVNSSIIVSKLFMGKDIREFGSGNAGSTNSYRMMGGKKTLLVMAGDLLKGIIAVLIAGFMFGEMGNFGGMGKMIAATFAIVGHIFPIFFGFKGGKGILTAAAVFGVFDIRILAIILGTFIIVVLICKFVSLASVCAAAMLPVAFLICGYDFKFFAIAFVTAALVIFMHRSNIGRLIKGTESKFSFKRKGDK
ncbi:MAG: glycerol-3-phosphate 1-O-acyltransferase PlsY [Clostridia bacterium]|nr:glycerol-3-phosphate 1-O-acyltransferase PlsY [Clostridia bacterium]